MKNTIWALLLSLAVIAPVQAKELKMGVVSVEAILKNAPQVTKINEKMQERFSKPQAELKSLGESIQKSQEKFKKDELILSKDQKAEAQKKILESIKEYREKEMQLKNEVESVRNQALAEFRFTVQQVLSKLAKDKGYDLILSEGVAYADKKLDLTEEVLKRLKAEASAK